MTPRNAILLLLGALLLAGGCSAKAVPAMDSEYYAAYQEKEVSAVREGFLVENLRLVRGVTRECFPQRPVRNVGGLDFSSSTGAQGTDAIRKIEVGEKILVHDIVHYEGLPGLWARATLEKDGEDCVINATQGLKIHLLLSDDEMEQWQKIPEDLRSRILAKEIKIGMSRAQVLIAWGPPFQQVPASAPGNVTETWIYQRGEKRLVYLNFEEDRLVGWRE